MLICENCRDQIPEPEDVTSEWHCSCGRYYVNPLPDTVVQIVKHNLAYFTQHHVASGIGDAFVFAHMEPWAVMRAVKEEPALIRGVFCPN